ncbi:TetR/AcrR family transcriptional regulator [Chitinophaga sp. 30R24]|uniref:TetR/AcrR family transcriptional regulator n=1 Tax=Chitinophaga sp. 30R24 TaxID=3248838 RepID=UPI003B9060DF
MSGRPKIFDDEEVIRKATEVFWRQGYEATSTEDLLTAMGIGKGSFYLAFKGGKKELFEKALQQFSENAIARFKQGLNATDNPIAYIKEFFLSNTQKMQQRGCFFGNTVAELSNTNALLMKKATHHLQMLEALFQEALQRGKQQGLLKSDKDPVLLARLLLNNWNGLGITRRMYPDNETLYELIEMQLKMLD